MRVSLSFFYVEYDWNVVAGESMLLLRYNQLVSIELQTVNYIQTLMRRV